MKRRSGAKVDADAADTTHSESSVPDPTDIFAGVQRQPLPSQALAKTPDDSKTDNSARSLGSSIPSTTGQPELPLNRLLAKYPRIFWYAAIAILGIIIGVLLGKKL